MTTLILSCQHQISADEHEEEGNGVRMAWCPEHDCYVGVERVES